MAKHLSLLVLAMTQPRRVWPLILSRPRDASWLYLWVAVESLLMQPADSARAIWAIARRGGGQAMNVLRLASVDVIVVIIGSYIVAFVVRLALRKSQARLEMGTYAAILPWLYAPKMLLTLLFAIGWAMHIVPDDGMTLTALLAGSLWSIAYHALSLAVVGWSLTAFFRSHVDRFDWSNDERTGTTSKLMRTIPIACFLCAIAAVGARASLAPRTFKPIGQGDRVSSLTFAPLQGATAAIDLTFPRERPVVVDFWATWCGPCVAALPNWQQHWLRREALQADFVSANVELDNLPGVKAFVDERGLAFPVHVADAATQGIFQITTLPTMLVLAPDGTIVDYAVGNTSDTEIDAALARAREK